MNIESYRNNALFHSDLSFPLKLTKVKKIEAREDYINHLSVIDDKIYGICMPGYLFCIDVESGEILWDKRRDYSFGLRKICGDKDKIYLQSGRPSCLNVHSGQTIWRSEYEGTVMGETAENLICRDVFEDTDSEEIFCLSKESGELLWSLKGGAHNYLDGVGLDGENIVLKGGDGIHVCDQNTGEVLWESKFQKLVDRISPGSKFTPPTAFGPTVDGLFFLGFSQIGLLAAFKIETGEPFWTYDFNENRMPGTIIYHEGKLYFNLFQIHETDNYLTCVDAKTGECKFKTKENPTPAGCKLPIITNNYFVTAIDKYISFFDLATQEFVWRHKAKKSLFRTYVCDNKMISYNIFKKEIYWLENK